MRVSRLLGLFTIAGALATGGCAAIEKVVAPKVPEPEHYVCSDFEVDERPVINPKQVTLTDQFGALGARVRLIKYLCAPASKKFDGKEFKPKDFKGPHLACYELRRIDPDKSVDKKVQITNQFEKKGLDAVVQSRKLLCVPSSKIEIPKDKEPEFDRESEIKKVEAALNHFVCSKLFVKDEDLKRGRLDVDMADQFGPFEGPMLKPDFLCAPAEKTFDGTQKKPQGGLTATHLACYVFVDERAVAFPKNVIVINQLDKVPQRGKPVKRYMFCVPTQKKRL